MKSCQRKFQNSLKEINLSLKQEFKKEKDKTKVAKVRKERTKLIKQSAKERAKEPHVGFMAQDLQKVFPEEVVKDDEGYLRIKETSKDKIMYMMFQTIKELDRTLQGLVTKVEELTKSVTDLGKRFDDLVKQYMEYNKRLNSVEKRLKALEKSK